MHKSKSPNVLIILTDQLRRQALCVYGDPNVSTPHIDALAQRGVRFDAACSTYAVCVPFRYTLMTGNYAHSANVPALSFRMDPAERTIADEYNEAGYHTIYVGKWHLDNCKLTNPVPRARQGRWQTWRGFEVRNAPFDTWYFEDDRPEPIRIEGYQTDGLFDVAMREIRTSAEGDQRPFCCVVSVEPPHYPYEAPAEYVERWTGRDIRTPPSFEIPVDYEMPLSHWPGDDTHTAEIKLERVRLYYAMIENLDDNVGRMTALLRENNLEDNTIVVFVSDHGEMGGAHALPTAMKEYPFEESIAIPLIVTDPRNKARAGAVISDPVCSEDLYPTLCGLAGIAHGRDLPGVDLTPLIDGREARVPREGIMLEHVRENRKPGAFYGTSFRGFRTRHYKYTVLAHEGEAAKPWQLFDLEADPYEQTNLVGTQAARATQEHLHALLCDRLKETGDAFVVAPL